MLYFFIGVIIGVATLLGWHYYKKAKYLQTRPALVNQKNVCKTPHRWVEVDLTMTNHISLSETAIKRVCFTCGIIPEDPKGRMLNQTALNMLHDNVRAQEYRQQLMAKVAPRLTFDAAIFYDQWLSENRDLLKEFLDDSNQIENLHNLLGNFLIQGTQTLESLKQHIIRDIEQENKF